MPPAARVADPTSHVATPLAPGPGSVTVLISFMPAWRALPASVGSAVESLSNTMNQFMTTPVLTPASAASKIAKISQGLGQAAGESAAAGNPAAVGASAGSLAAVNTTNVALSATWTTASAAPGGQPAANVAYTEGIKATVAAAASAVFAAIGPLADTHVCPMPVPIPPHGPGMVTKGSKTVVINNLPAARQGDKVMEACGGGNPIAMGCPTVLIGDDEPSGGGGGGAAGGGGGSSAAGGAAEGATEAESPAESAVAAADSDEGGGESMACSNPACSGAFSSAAQDGTPLVDRDSQGC